MTDKTKKTKRLMILHEDNGFCRIVYKLEGGTSLYCLQDEGDGYGYGGILLYRCTDDWEEPIYTIKLNSVVEIEAPKGESRLATSVRKYINEHNFLIAV